MLKLYHAAFDGTQFEFRIVDSSSKTTTLPNEDFYYALLKDFLAANGSGLRAVVMKVPGLDDLRFSLVHTIGGNAFAYARELDVVLDFVRLANFRLSVWNNSDGVINLAAQGTR